MIQLRAQEPVRIVSDPVIRAFENGSVVLLRPEVPDWIRTTDAGAWVVEQLRQAPRTPDELVAAMARRYGLPDEAVRASTLRLLEALIDQGYAAQGASRGTPAVPLRLEELPLRQLWLHVTSHCNLRCRHCYYRVQDAGCDLPLTTAQRLVREAAEFGVTQLVVSGGEPLLHPEIPELVRILRELPNATLKLVSNGTLPPEPRLDPVMAGIDDLQVSIDGIDAASHDAIRGSGAFARTVRLFKHLHDRHPRLRRGIAFTPTPANVEQLSELHHLAYRLAVDYIHVNQGKPPADPRNGSALSAEGFFSPEFARRALLQFRRLYVNILGDRRDATGLNYRPLALDASYTRTLCFLQPLRMDTCGAGITNLALDPDGGVYPCAALCGRSECRLGSYPESSLAELRRAGQAWNRRVFSVDRDPRCAGCVYRYFCGGGCRAAGESLFGRDPACGALFESFDEFLQYVALPSSGASAAAVPPPGERWNHARSDGCATV